MFSRQNFVSFLTLLRLNPSLSPSHSVRKRSSFHWMLHTSSAGEMSSALFMGLRLRLEAFFGFASCNGPWSCNKNDKLAERDVEASDALKTNKILALFFLQKTIFSYLGLNCWLFSVTTSSTFDSTAWT